MLLGEESGDLEGRSPRSLVDSRTGSVLGRAGGSGSGASPDMRACPLLFGNNWSRGQRSPEPEPKPRSNEPEPWTASGPAPTLYEAPSLPGGGASWARTRVRAGGPGRRTSVGWPPPRTVANPQVRNRSACITDAGTERNVASIRTDLREPATIPARTQAIDESEQMFDHWPWPTQSFTATRTSRSSTGRRRLTSLSSGRSRSG